MTGTWPGDGDRVLLDTVALIYLLERHPRHGATALAGGADGILSNNTGLRRLQAEDLSIWRFDDHP